jgi:hypothetical protein
MGAYPLSMTARRSPLFSQRRGHIAAVIALGGVTLLFFSGLFVGQTNLEVSRFQRVVYPWGNPDAAPHSPQVIHYDQAKSFYPWQVFINSALRSGQVPLWNPESFAGTPFLAANANNALYPPRMALSLIASPARVHDILVTTHMFIAGLAMYVLLVYLGVSMPSAFLGAISWMASSFMLAWLALEHFVVVAALLPVAILLTDRSIRRRSWSSTLTLGVVLTLLFLGGNLLFVELCFATVVLYAAALVAVSLREHVRRGGLRLRTPGSASEACRLLLPWALCIGLSAITLLPTVALIRRMARAPLSYSELRGFRLPVSELTNLLQAPNVHEPSFLRDPYHAALFGGTAVALLGAVGFFASRRGAWFARILATGTLLVALGTPMLALPYFALPGFDNLKPLGRVLFLFAFALSMLGAFGLDAVIAWLRQRFTSAWAATVIATVCAIAICATLVQLRVYARSIVHMQENSAALTYPATPLIQLLKRHPNARIFPSGNVLPGSTAMVYGLRNALGYESIVPARIQDFWRVVAGLRPDQLATQRIQSAFELAPSPGQVRVDLLRRASVDYLITRPMAAGSELGSGLDPLYEGSDGAVFRVVAASPTVYLVSGCEEASDARTALARFQEARFDPKRAVILERSQLASSGVQCGRRSGGPAPGSAQLVRRRINDLTIQMESPTRAFLVVNEAWDPGWQATVDTRSAPVLAANSMFRAIPVAAGRHTVVLRYRPRPYEAGLWITRVSLLLTLVGFATVAFRAVGRRRRDHHAEHVGAPLSK